MKTAASLTDGHNPHQAVGSVYTPHFVTNFMARTVLNAVTADPLSPELNDLQILDPACGDGALLTAVWAHLSRTRSSSEPLNIVRRQLHGVDIDFHAVQQLRECFWQLWPQLTGSDSVSPALARRQELEAALQNQVLVGNALTGDDFSRSTTVMSPDVCQLPTAISWQSAFPHVGKRGGFDLVIGNPPYLRERDAKSVFDEVARSRLGHRWKQARMDLWFYFLHRGLDLLRPGGRLIFIVNSYWTRSQSASKLIQRLQQEVTLEHIVLLGKAPLFPGVSGQHMILQLVADQRDTHCQIVDAQQSPSVALELLRGKHDVPGLHRFELSQSQLYNGRQLQYGRQPALQVDDCRMLESKFQVRQGIAENPPVVSRKHLQLVAELRLGEGVFVLKPDEIEELQLSFTDRQLLRRYFEPRDISRYGLCEQRERYVLYLTPRTLADIQESPALHRHLSRFRVLTEQRRETRMGRVAWYHLHWPRQETIFCEPRILCRQMGQAPAFVYTEREAFVGFSVNVITRRESAGLSLPALTGMLNSQFARSWFDAHAKRRGVNLEINGRTLRDFPLPCSLDEKFDRQLTMLVQQRQALQAECPAAAELEAQIDDLIDSVY